MDKDRQLHGYCMRRLLAKKRRQTQSLDAWIKNVERVDKGFATLWLQKG